MCVYLCARVFCFAVVIIKNINKLIGKCSKSCLLLLKPILLKRVQLRFISLTAINYSSEIQVRC